MKNIGKSRNKKEKQNKILEEKNPEKESWKKILESKNPEKESWSRKIKKNKFWIRKIQKINPGKN